jgi:hypothetical protein
VTTGVVDVVEPGECPVVRARRKARELSNLELGDRRLSPKRRKRAVAQVVVPFPELEHPEVDID